MMKKAAIVGCGRMGAFTSEGVLRHAPRCWLPLSHCEAVIAHGGMEIVALADVDSDMLQKAAKKYGVGRTYRDLSALLTENALDLLCIATRTPGRADMIVNAYDSGVKAIHTEKPLCNTTHELHTLSALFAQEDFHFTWGAIRRHLPVYKQALELVNSFEYGKLIEVRVNFGSAPLFWTHAHAFDLLTFVAQERRLESVHAKLRNFHAVPGQTLCVESDPIIEYCVIGFEDGVNGFITQSTGADLILTCERGEISVIDDGAFMNVRHYKLGAYPEFTNIPIEPTSVPTGTLAPIAMLSDCLDGVSKSIHANRKIKRDIIQSQRMMFASVLSHAEGGRKVIDFLDMPEIEIRGLTNNRPA
jgi:predicted dehydrogenase